jgi:diguanylate cyclase (GGDEF)-like protein
MTTDPDDELFQDGPDRGAWLVLLVGGAVLLLGLLVEPAGVDRLVAGLVTLAAVAAIVVVSRRDPAVAPSWLLLAGAATAGGALSVLPLDPGTVARDLVRLLAGVLLLASLVGFARARQVGPASWIEGLTVGAGLGLLVLESVATPLFTQAATPWRGALAALPLLLHVLVLGCVVALTTTPGTTAARSARLLFTGVGLAVLTGLGSALLSSRGLSPNTAAAGWLVAALCFGAAALHLSSGELTRAAPSTDTSLSRLRLALVAVAALVAPALVAAGQWLPVAPHPVTVVVGAVVLYGLLLARLTVAVRQLQAAAASREELQAQLVHDATHDPLTQLPNRSRGLSIVRRALADDRGSGATTAVLFLDLDGFKYVNDTLGHKAGDTVLRLVADRLRGAVREGDAAIRFGGDEFLVVLRDVPDTATATTVARRLIRAISQPIVLGSDSVGVGASVGVALSRGGSGSAARVIHEADIAAYVAMGSGRGRAEVYDDSMRSDHHDRRAVESELRLALANDELVLAFQPIVDTFTGAVEGFEALVRWSSPRRGLLLPAEFLPIAEESDLILDIDAWVMEHAAREAAGWAADPDLPETYVAVNVAPQHLSRARVVDDVQRAIARSGLPPRLLTLEVGERVLADTVGAVPHLRRLRNMGVRVTVDDYGSGFGSLSALSELPVDAVKISRQHLDVSTERSRTLLDLMVQGAHTVGLSAMAQGVEIDAQLATLRRLDCQSVQGFHIARPMSGSEATAFARDRRRDRFAGLLTALPGEGQAG